MLCVLLGYPDSNQERQDQNLQCYHYTISQFMYCNLSPHCVCKVTNNFYTSNIFRKFFLIKSNKRAFFGVFSRFSDKSPYLCIVKIGLCVAKSWLREIKAQLLHVDVIRINVAKA